MEWLKTILEKAVITDGKLDVDATMKEINAEFPKHAVPKQDYNDKVKELGTANDTIKDLKKIMRTTQICKRRSRTMR